MEVIQNIQNRIYKVRGERVMLDFDLAALYEVETKVLNQAVKRNKRRFPEDFMFRLTLAEWQSMQAQFVTVSENHISSRSQIVTLNTGRGYNLKYLPYAFTEQGFGMLSGVLNSDRAVEMHIAIIRAFVEIRKILISPSDIKEQLKEIKEHLGNHDEQLNQLYDAMGNLIDENAAKRKWEERERIGFKRSDE